MLRVVLTTKVALLTHSSWHVHAHCTCCSNVRVQWAKKLGPVLALPPTLLLTSPVCCQHPSLAPPPLCAGGGEEAGHH